MPLKFPSNCLAADASLHNTLTLSCFINTGTPHKSWGSASHTLKSLFQDDTRIELVLDKDSDDGDLSTDFEIQYFVRQSSILGSMIVQSPPPPPDYETQQSAQASTSKLTGGGATLLDEEEWGNFALFMTPPQPADVKQFYGRTVVFVLDRSGSMTGDPMTQAIRAITFGIRGLGERDAFTIFAFNHNMQAWSAELVRATDKNKEQACLWCESIQPAGLTEIMDPLRKAVELLEQTKGLPFVFLITDGAVKDEREICTWVKDRRSRVRVLSFGIGVWCNHQFLRMLAQIGRGWTEVAFKSDEIYGGMFSLLSAATTPVLTDLRIQITGAVRDVELYPYPIPDLYVGKPIVVSGRFRGTFPPQARLLGVGPDGKDQAFELPARTATRIPISRIFVRQQLDLMTAQAWLLDSKALVNQVVDLSIKENMPCAHTSMVAYETTAERKARRLKAEEEARQRRRQEEMERREKERSRASQETEEQRSQREKEERRRTRKMKKKGRQGISRATALAIGGVVVIGVAAVAFGSMAMTDANAASAAGDVSSGGGGDAGGGDAGDAGGGGDADGGGDGECCGDCEGECQEFCGDC